MKGIKKIFSIFTVVITCSVVNVYAEKPVFQEKTLQFINGTLELYSNLFDDRTTRDYFITFTLEGDNWKTIDTVVFSNDNDSEIVDATQISIATKMFDTFVNMAKENGLDQTVLDMKCDAHFVYYKQSFAKLDDGKTALVKLYYYNPFSSEDEGR